MSHAHGYSLIRLKPPIGSVFAEDEVSKKRAGRAICGQLSTPSSDIPYRTANKCVSLHMHAAVCVCACVDVCGAIMCVYIVFHTAEGATLESAALLVLLPAMAAHSDDCIRRSLRLVRF